MKINILKASIMSLLTLVLLQTCAIPKNLNQNNRIFWVSGLKSECSAGAGKMQCLQVHRGESIDAPQWENFYAHIEGFQFEEGLLQKIEVKEEHLDKSRVPADASSIKYTLVKVLEKQQDLRTVLNGNWTLQSLNNHPLNKMTPLPTMAIDLSKMQISGSNGCNTYFGEIESLAPAKIKLGNVGSTKKMCRDMRVADEFDSALNSINTYQVKGSNVIFFSENGEKVLSFMKDKASLADQGIHDIWVATRIEGNPINRMVTAPRMEINLTTGQVMGNNSCNNYTGKIEEVTDSKLIFGTIATDRKMCAKMDIADRFNKALNRTASYKKEGLELMIYDEAGNEMLSFLKVD